jgi:protease II
LLRWLSLQPTLKGSYLYYSKRGPGDDYWNMYRLPLQQQQQNEAASAPAGQQVTNLAKAVQAAAAAVQSAAAAEAADAGTSSVTSSHAKQQSGNQPPSSQQQQQQDMVAAEQLVLDENSLSAGHSYWDVYEKQLSPDGSRVAFTYDTVGDERYSLQVGNMLVLLHNSKHWYCNRDKLSDTWRQQHSVHM